VAPILHVATIHINSPRWMPIQARELRRHMTMPHRMWASLEGIDPAAGTRLGYRVVSQTGHHGVKLNGLAERIVAEADGDDLVMFLDGDAFPIADPAPLISAGLAAAPLMAVRRSENCDDPQPHPCFCVTDVETWRRLPGDWRIGGGWPGPGGRTAMDVGGILLDRLEETRTAWTPVLRSNRTDLHPLLFGIYGDAVYHHGAGFRAPFSRMEAARLRSGGRQFTQAERHEVIERNRRQSDAMFDRISGDDPDWLAALM
jgi:hypothetical protein